MGCPMRACVTVFVTAIALCLAVPISAADAAPKKSKAAGGNPVLCGKTPDRPDATLENCAAEISMKGVGPGQVAEARYFRALAYQRLGELEKSVIELDEAVRMAPRLSVVLVARASANMARHAWDRALADIEVVLADEADDANALALRGSIRLVQGQYAAALQDLDAALDSALPQAARASVHNNRGLAHEKLGSRDRAVADYRKALAAKPSDSVKDQALKGLARLGTDQGSPGAAAALPSAAPAASGASGSGTGASAGASPVKTVPTVTGSTSAAGAAAPAPAPPPPPAAAAVPKR